METHAKLYLTLICFAFPPQTSHLHVGKVFTGALGQTPFSFLAAEKKHRQDFSWSSEAVAFTKATLRSNWYLV